MTTATDDSIRDEDIAELDDDALDNIAGGKYHQVAYDSKTRMEAGYLTEYPGDECKDWDAVSANVEEAWARAGVRCVTSRDGHNEYYLRGHRIKDIHAHSWISCHPAK